MKIQKNLEELDYDLELDRVANEIKKQKAKKILLQFPEGLKPYATQVVNHLKKQINGNAEIFVWFDSCFGACDVPLETEKLGIDMIIQFGHSDWKFNDTKNNKNLKILK